MSLLWLSWAKSASSALCLAQPIAMSSPTSLSRLISSSNQVILVHVVGQFKNIAAIAADEMSDRFQGKVNRRIYILVDKLTRNIAQ